MLPGRQFLSSGLNQAQTWCEIIVRRSMDYSKVSHLISSRACETFAGIELQISPPWRVPIFSPYAILKLWAE